MNIINYLIINYFTYSKMYHKFYLCLKNFALYWNMINFASEFQN